MEEKQTKGRKKEKVKLTMREKKTIREQIKETKGTERKIIKTRKKRK